MMSDFGSGEFTMAVNEDAVVDFQRFSVTVITHAVLVSNLAHTHRFTARGLN